MTRIQPVTDPAKTAVLVQIFRERVRRQGTAYVLDSAAEWRRSNRSLRRIAAKLGFDSGRWYDNCCAFCKSYTPPPGQSS